MARPRRDERGPSAKERLQLAFWDLLEKSPSASITVKELSAKAGVNHNTFYYHYGSMTELARDAVLSSVSDGLTGTLLTVLVQSPLEPEKLPDDTQLAEPYRRMRLLARNGSFELLRAACDVIVGRWLERFGIGSEELTDDDRMRISFAWGGIVTLIGSDQADTIAVYRAAIEGGIGNAVSGLLRQILSEHGVLPQPSRDGRGRVV